MEQVEIIAEIGQAHDGSLGILHSMIDAVAKTGVKTVKFQTHIAEAESSAAEPFRTKFSYVDKTRYDYWKRMEFTKEQWHGIFDHCTSLGLEFLSSPFSLAAVELLEELGIKRYKIGSGEVSNLLLLERIALTKKPLLVSSGMSTFQELDETTAYLKKRNLEFSLLHCTSKYPTAAEHVGINVVTEMKSRYQGIKIGLSDHSGQIFPSLAAVTLGAQLIEVHVTFDKSIFGPDSTSSLTFAELKLLASGVDFISKMKANPVNKNDVTTYESMRNIFQKSLAVNRPMSTGDIISFKDLESKKPANMGISASNFESVIGKKVRRNMAKYEFLNQDDLSS